MRSVEKLTPPAPLAPARSTPVGSPLLRSDPPAVRGELICSPPDKGELEGV